MPPMSRGWVSGAASRALACRSYFFHPFGYNSMKGSWSCLGPNASSTEHTSALFFLACCLLAKIKSNVVPKRWKIIFKSPPPVLSTQEELKNTKKQTDPGFMEQWRKPETYSWKHQPRELPTMWCDLGPSTRCSEKERPDRHGRSGSQQWGLWGQSYWQGLVGGGLRSLGWELRPLALSRRRHLPWGLWPGCCLKGRGGLLWDSAQAFIHPQGLWHSMGRFQTSSCPSRKIKPGEFSQHQ